MIVNCFFNQFVFSVIIIPEITGIVVTGECHRQFVPERSAGIKISMALKASERPVTVALQQILTEIKSVK